MLTWLLDLQQFQTYSGLLATSFNILNATIVIRLAKESASYHRHVNTASKTGVEQTNKTLGQNKVQNGRTVNHTHYTKETLCNSHTNTDSDELLLQKLSVASLFYPKNPAQ